MEEKEANKYDRLKVRVLTKMEIEARVGERIKDLSESRLLSEPNCRYTTTTRSQISRGDYAQVHDSGRTC